MNNKTGLFCGSKSNGGLERNLVKLANLLFKAGKSVVFFAPADAPYKELLDSEIPFVGITKHKKYLDFISAKRFGKSFKEQGITKLIFRHNKDLDVLVWAKKFVHPDLELFFWQAMQLGISKKGFYHSLKFNSLSKWIATLEGLKQQVLEKTKINPAKVEVIPLPLDLEKFNQPSLSQTEAREKFQLPSDVNIMGVIGRIDPKKGQQFVIQALAKIKNWHLLVLGEPTRGEYENHLEELKQLAVKLGLEERVHFRPFTQNLAPVYKSLNLMVMATQAETFGAVTIEAMASRTPVLGTSSGGTPEILENGKLGFLYESNNQKSFLQVFEEFNNNNELVAQKVGLARQAAKLKYDEKAVLKQSLDVLG